MTTTFASMGIRQELVHALRTFGIASPTPVQEQGIPALLSGEDAIVQAQTGTGKTLAFLLPILEIINPQKPGVQALILTPTRELAIQITAEAKKLAPVIGAGVLAVYGGQDVDAQVHKLKGSTHIVVATPGRLLDHLRRGTIELHQVSMFVLDEADQMLAMGFLNEVEEVILQLSTRRQTMLFSATMPGPVRVLAANYMKKPVDILIRGKQITLDDIRQIAVDTTDRGRAMTLFKMIEIYNPYLAVVFCRTKIRTKQLTEKLIANGIEADELHGDLTQAKREAVMKRFRDAKLQILVATDVAARGLDVEGVTHVFNYDVPHDTESYIHRIGRTGRAGQQGVAITLVSPKDRGALQHIERGIGKTLERRNMAEFGVGHGNREEEQHISKSGSRQQARGGTNVRRESGREARTDMYGKSPSGGRRNDRDRTGIGAASKAGKPARPGKPGKPAARAAQNGGRTKSAASASGGKPYVRKPNSSFSRSR